MSHFAVAVITDKPEVTYETIRAALLPYMENCCEEPPKEYMTFHDEEDERLSEYENDSVIRVKMPDGRLLPPWDDEFRVDKSRRGVFGADTHEVPEHLPFIEVPYKELYATFEQFMSECQGYSERDPEKGRYGYWQNDNAKWDWFQVGGRWSYMLRATDGGYGDLSWARLGEERPAGRFDSAKIKDIDFSDDQEAYDRAIARWEYNIEGKEGDEDLKWWESAEYMIKRYGDKETYAKLESTFFLRAVVTPDGEWHEVGKMGWWGASSENGDEYVDWALHFKERFVDPCDPEWFLTIVDCHI